MELVSYLYKLVAHSFQQLRPSGAGYSCLAVAALLLDALKFPLQCDKPHNNINDWNYGRVHGVPKIPQFSRFVQKKITQPLFKKPLEFLACVRLLTSFLPGVLIKLEEITIADHPFSYVY